MNAGAPALDRFRLVQQHPDAHLLERRHHANRIVLAEYAEDGSFKALMEARHAGKRIRIGSKCLRPLVSGQHADVVAGAAHEFGHASHRRFAHLHMEIADLQNGEALSDRRRAKGYG
jgi:hypothetical protein